MRQDPDGTRILQVGTRRGVTRVCQWLKRRERWFYLEQHGVRYVVHWKPWQGLWVTSRHVKSLARVGTVYRTPRPETSKVKKLKLATGTGAPALGVGAGSVILGKCPKIREHLTATTYEDGDMRTPGYLWLKTTSSQWVLTLFSPDDCARLDCRAATLDEVLMLAEKWLSVEDAPWEIDTYLQEKKAKTKKKRGA